MKTGASFTYDVTEQLFQPLQNGRYTFAGSPTAPTPFQFTQSFALTPEARLMFPKAYGVIAGSSRTTGAWQQPDAQLGLRYDVEIIKDIPDWPAGTDADNFDPRVGFAWDPKGDQKWAVRGGFGASRSSTRSSPSSRAASAAATDRSRSFDADRSAVPDSPTRCRRFRRAPCCRRAASRRSRPTWRTSTRGRRASASSGNSAAHERGRGCQHQSRRQARLPRHERAGADSEGRAQRGAQRESQCRRPHRGAGRWTRPIVPGTTASGTWTC